MERKINMEKRIKNQPDFNRIIDSKEPVVIKFAQTGVQIANAWVHLWEKY
jgi:hypothetical protein